tara:strand:- start:3737 stop:4168 length:432 start_codon:yes stop_codon:yes gene_type:complete
MALHPEIWGPHYWFFLHTLTISYPVKPNDVTKKIYYNFIHNLPLFIPVEEIGNSFSKMLDKYPVKPYLDSRKSFIKWMHFIHNKINIMCNKEEITLDEAMEQYYNNYKPKQNKNIEEKKQREKLIFMGIIILLICISIFLYNK